MKARALGSLLCVVGVLGCAEDDMPVEPQTYAVPVFSHGAAGAKNFRTHMTGDAERPTPNDSRAQGQAIFQVQADGTVTYRLIVANIENVTQAHIHCCADVNNNAGIAVWLYPNVPPLAPTLIPGRSQGPLATGVITDANVGGALTGTGVAGLLAAIQAGTAYVNVHTTQFPPGEIRGQID